MVNLYSKLQEMLDQCNGFIEELEVKKEWLLLEKAKYAPLNDEEKRFLSQRKNAENRESASMRIPFSGRC